MKYIIQESERLADRDELLQENLALKKKITVLETANAQLIKERNTYKAAYEKWSGFFVIRFIKRITGRE